MKKSLALILAILSVLCIALSGCGSSTGATICLGPYPDTLDPAKNTTLDGASYVIHFFSGLIGYNEAGELVADCAKEIPEATTTADGKTSYTFELKDNLKWSDGSALTAEDFVWSWNRAVSPDTAADYAYMFDVIDGYDKASAGEGTLNVTADNENNTLTVVLTNNVPYFMELCAFPTYLPVKKDVVDGNDAWATSVDTYICNGPYKMVEFTKAKVVLEKNDNYHNADAIKTDKITCAFNEDDNSILTNYKNGSYKFIDTIANSQIKTIKEQYPDEYTVVGQLGTYYVSFNANDPTFADYTEAERVKIRQALGLLLDRNHICENVAMGGQVPANSFVPMDMTDADGKTEFVDKNGVNGDGAGYFSVNADDYKANCDQAVALFKEVAKSSGKFTVSDDGVLSGFPSLTYITNTDTTHEAIATYIQATYKLYGITLDIKSQEWQTFVDTRKAGDYSLARNGWVADYNDPISFLDMWLSDSGNNDCQLGKGEHAAYKGYSYGGKDNLTWAESYDKLIAEIKSTNDPAKRFELMHEAENMIMSTGTICPIYYYTDIFMCNQSIEGFFTSKLGYKYFMYATF